MDAVSFGLARPTVLIRLNALPMTAVAESNDTQAPAFADLPAMREGVPTLAELDGLKTTAFYGDFKGYSDRFLAAHKAALKGYGRHWGEDPMHLWSRRWEYPFAARAVLAHAARTGRDDLRCCDAGSGVTFLPYLLCERLPETTFVAVDTNQAYVPMFKAVANNVGHDRVTFKEAAIQKLPFADGSLDVLMCVSVLEHTGDYANAIAEVARVIAPGGRLVLTFDLSLDEKFELTRASSTTVLKTIAEHFEADADELVTEAAKAYDGEVGLLSTPEVREREPQHLPWKYPKLQAIYDLVRGYGWTGGFRSVAPFCLDVARR